MPRDPLLSVLKREVAHQSTLAPSIAREAGLEVYAPLAYAWETYSDFVRSYRPKPGGLLLCGLNPGPYGVGQTGIPFTDVRTARSRLSRIGFDRDLPGYAPPPLHELLTLTWERSSLCVYNFFDHAYGGVEAAYDDLFVIAYSWLLYVDRARKPWNVTPDDPRLRRRQDLEEAFARLVHRTLPVLRPRGAVAIGRFAAERLPRHLPEEMPIVEVRHPAREPPKTWGRDVARALRGAGLL